MIADAPVKLGEDWLLMNTDMVAEALGEGLRVFLPHVSVPDDDVLSYYNEADASLFDIDPDSDEIVSVEFVGYEPVQCIAVDDENHLYLTDGAIPTHNTSNIVFLKSTDDSMIDTLEKMSGKTHRAYGDSKMITRNLARIFFQNEDNSSVTISVKEEPVVKYNDLAFLSERNSIVFRAGDPPIWNRNELILPMSWRLFLNKIEHPGRDYSLQTIPTLSSAIDFDVRKNQPDFEAMVNKRLSQAIYAEEARELYKQVFGYSDYDVAQLDPDIYADSVMDIISARINADSGHDADDYVPDANVVAKTLPHTELNQEQIAEAKRIKSENQKFSKAIYAKGRLSRDDIAQFDQGGRILWISHSLDVPLSECFKSNRREFERDTAHFQVRDGNLYDVNGRMLYISKAELSDAEASTISRGIYDRDIPVYSEDKVRPADVGGYIITDGFYRFLLQQDSWNAIAGGVIERAIAKHLE